jgi:hypothetical protein
MGTCSKPDKYQEKMKEWKQDAKNVLNQNEKANKTVDSLLSDNKKKEEVIAQKDKRITKLEASAATKRASAQSLLELANILATKECPCTEARAAAEGFKAEADTLRAAVGELKAKDTIRLAEISNLKIGINTLQFSNDSLVKVIKTVPEYKGDKIFGFIPKPSRPVVFVLGTVTGAVVGNEVRKAVTRK